MEAGLRWRRSRRPRQRCRSCAALPLCGGGCPAPAPVCGEEESEAIRKNCQVAEGIYQRFRATPEVLLALAGVT
ncbi:MAG: hypothetical protein K6T75_02265 [Acetobacteraceae bacterium]|nr:hypothetical protein [Acetobacteraceae bacterium]